MSSLDINANRFLKSDVTDIADPVEAAVRKFDVHPSILDIKDNVLPKDFHFSSASLDDIQHQIKLLNSKKSGTFRDIPVKLIKSNCDIIGSDLQDIWNKEIMGGRLFPGKLKLAYLNPIYKKLERIL